MIPYARQNIDQTDVDAVSKALRSDFLTQGPILPEFEDAIARRAGCSHAVAVNSGTSALHVACLALGLGPGDLLWTVPNTFVASANCGRLCGADVDFVDIDATHYSMDAGALSEKLETAANAGRLPKIVIPVHYAGRSADMSEICRLAREYDVRVIEDAAHAIGGSYRDAPIGSCAFSDVAVFSFHPVKVMTTAEGGAATTNDAELSERMALLGTHGVTRDKGKMENQEPRPWEYEQLALGLNYRMTELQAALGLSQLKRLDAFVARRRQLAERYGELLAGLPLILPRIEPRNESAWHLYPVLIDAEKTEVSRDEALDSLHAAGIRANVHFIPVHTQPYYRKLGFKPGDFPVSEWFYRHEISLPLYHDLADDQQLQVVAAMREIFA